METLQEISRQHGLGTNTTSLLPQAGIFNLIYALGEDYVLRVPRDHPISADAAHKESVAVLAAREAGVRTPGIVAFDDTLDLLPVPYTIYERVHGETLGLLPKDPAEVPRVWKELGHDLALLHARVSEDGPAASLEIDARPDPRPWPGELAEEGYFTATEAGWLEGWLERLAPAALAPVPRCFLHGDSQATNVMVRRGSLEYLAVLDWGSSGVGLCRRSAQGRASHAPGLPCGRPARERRGGTHPLAPSPALAVSAEAGSPTRILMGRTPAGNAPRRHAFPARLPRTGEWSEWAP